MGYSAADEDFTHQLPRPFDTVHSDDPSWSDRCYFYAASPDGSMMVASGYGNNPNTANGLGYGKVSLADGRHWDLVAGRPVTGADRADLHAGPMRWTCVEPLKRWTLSTGPNPSGIEWELHYQSRLPMWELQPIAIDDDEGRTLVDMFHIKESGRWSGWLGIDGKRISVNGFHGGRDRTFGVRAADRVDFWLWIDAGFEDRAIQAWIFEKADGSVQYVDGGITHADRTLSKRFVAIHHHIDFDGDLKRPIRATLEFTDEDGATHHVRASTVHPAVNAYYGLPLPRYQHQAMSNGSFFGHYLWDSTELNDLRDVEARSMAVDQLMTFEFDGMTGSGIFEVLVGGRGYQRYPNLRPLDLAGLARQAASDPAELHHGGEQ